MKINDLYKPLYTSKCRYTLLTGGRASLKSSSVHDFISRLTFQQGHGILFTRYTMTSAEKSIIPEFRQAIKRNNSEAFFNITNNRITNNETGSFILFTGIKTSSGDQTANLKSLSGITTLVVEEGEDFTNEEAFDRIDDSIRSNIHQNRVIWIQNPSTKEHFIYKRFIQPYPKIINRYGYDITTSGHPDVEHIHTTYHIAKEYLSDSFLEKVENIKKTNPKKYYHTYIGGWLEKAEGAIFENWRVGDFDESLPYCYGLDLGYYPDPSALVKTAVDKNNKKVYVKECFYETKLYFDGLFDKIKENNTNMVIADTNEPRVINEYIGRGIRINMAEKYAGSVLDSIKRLQDYEIIVDQNSTNIIKELQNYVWNDKKSGVPIGEYDHCFTGDTIISTLEGNKRIDEIKVGDLVSNTYGYNKVLRVFNNGIKKVHKYSLHFGTFSLSLCSTKDHVVKTKEGWMKISELQSGMTVYLDKNLIIENLNYSQKKDILIAERLKCIGMFGSITTARGQKGFMYTTKTVTHGIIKLKTLSLFKAKSICQTTQNKELKTIQNFTNCFGGRVMKKREKIKKRVCTTPQNLNKCFQKNQERVGKELSTSIKNAQNVKKYLLVDVKTQPQYIAIKIVRCEQEEKGLKKVYDLEIENNHEYSANGLVVHNSLSATRYAFMYLTKGSFMFI